MLCALLCQFDSEKQNKKFPRWVMIESGIPDCYKITAASIKICFIKQQLKFMEYI